MMSTDGGIAYVPRKEGWGGIIGLEAPMGSLKINFQDQQGMERFSRFGFDRFLGLPR